MSATTAAPIDPTAHRPLLAHTRAVLLVVAYGLLSLWALALAAPGVAAVLGGGLPDPSLRFLAVGATSFKLLTVGAAVAVLLTRGGSVLAVRVLVAGQVVWLVADLLTPQGDDGVLGAALRLPLSLAIWVGPWLLLTTDRRRLWRQPLQVRMPLAAVAVLGAVPLGIWSAAASRVGLPASLPGDEAAELRFDACGLPVALLAAVALCSLHRARWWDAGVGAVCVALAVLAVTVPTGPASPGSTGLLLLAVPVLLLGTRRSGPSTA